MEIRTGTVIVASIIAAGMFVFVGCEAAGIPHDKGKSNFSAVKSMGTWYEQGPRRARVRIKDGYLDYDTKGGWNTTWQGYSTVANVCFLCNRL